MVFDNRNKNENFNICQNSAVQRVNIKTTGLFRAQWEFKKWAQCSKKINLKSKNAQKIKNDRKSRKNGSYFENKVNEEWILAVLKMHNF